jgi:DNA-binding ferritin-like protein
MEEVVQKTLEELMKNKLIPENERDNEKITEELKEAAQKEEKLTAEMEPMIGNKNMREVEQAMSFSSILLMFFGQLLPYQLQE